MLLICRVDTSASADDLSRNDLNVRVSLPDGRSVLVFGPEDANSATVTVAGVTLAEGQEVTFDVADRDLPDPPDPLGLVKATYRGGELRGRAEHVDVECRRIPEALVTARVAEQLGACRRILAGAATFDALPPAEEALRAAEGLAGAADPGVIAARGDVAAVRARLTATPEAVGTGPGTQRAGEPLDHAVARMPALETWVGIPPDFFGAQSTSLDARVSAVHCGQDAASWSAYAPSARTAADCVVLVELRARSAVSCDAAAAKCADKTPLTGELVTAAGRRELDPVTLVQGGAAKPSVTWPAGETVTAVYAYSWRGFADDVRLGAGGPRLFGIRAFNKTLVHLRMPDNASGVGSGTAPRAPESPLVAARAALLSAVAAEPPAGAAVPIQAYSRAGAMTGRVGWIVCGDVASAYGRYSARGEGAAAEVGDCVAVLEAAAAIDVQCSLKECAGESWSPAWREGATDRTLEVAEILVGGAPASGAVKKGERALVVLLEGWPHDRSPHVGGSPTAVIELGFFTEARLPAPGKVLRPSIAAP